MSTRMFVQLATCLIIVTLSLPNHAAAQKKQGQARLDSLLAEAPKIKEDTNAVKLMSAVAYMYQSIDAAEGLSWAQKELDLSRRIGWSKGMGIAYQDFGINYSVKGAYPDALDAFLKSMRIWEEEHNEERIGVTSGNIGIVYYRLSSWDKAIEYQQRALKIAEKRGDKQRLQAALGNLGIVYGQQGKYQDALEYKLRGLKMSEELNDKRGIIYQNINIGATYTTLKQYGTSIAYERKALRTAEETGDRISATRALGNIGQNYVVIGTDTGALKPDSLVLPTRKANLDRGIEYLQSAIASARQQGYKDQIPPFNDALYQALSAAGDDKGSLAAYKEGIAMHDSLFNKETDARIIRTEQAYKLALAADSIKLEGEKRALRLQQEAQLAVLHRDYERRQALAKTEKERRQLQYEEAAKSQQISATFRQKEAEADAAHQRTAALAKTEEERKTALTSLAIRRQKNLLYTSLGGGLLMLLIGGFAFRAYRQRRDSNLIIAAEREKSEALLRNILPAEVAKELKNQGHSIARQYDDVSVLFTDFVNFTAMGEQLSPQVLVKELHECFSAFDAIIKQNGLEKIKTIGDAYMAVCGLPQSDPRHAQNCVKAATEIRNFIAERGRRERVFEIRIGINSGPVVAGIVGVKKFAYDIWGDTVNTAARMEQHGEPGRINISQSTYELVKDDYRCDYRGQIAAKNKGEVAMYFVETSVHQNTLQTV